MENNIKLTYKDNMKTLRASAKERGLKNYSKDNKATLCEKLGVKAPKRKDKDAPKKARTAFILFSQDNREKVTTDYKKKTGEDMKFGQVAKELGARWKTANPKVVEEYKKKSEADKKRYEKAMQAYKPSTPAKAKTPATKKGKAKKVEKKVEKEPTEESEYPETSEMEESEKPKKGKGKGKKAPAPKKGKKVVEPEPAPEEEEEEEQDE